MRGLGIICAGVSTLVTISAFTVAFVSSTGVQAQQGAPKSQARAQSAQASEEHLVACSGPGGDTLITNPPCPKGYKKERSWNVEPKGQAPIQPGAQDAQMAPGATPPGYSVIEAQGNKTRPTEGCEKLAERAKRLTGQLNEPREGLVPKTDLRASLNETRKGQEEAGCLAPAKR